MKKLMLFMLAALLGIAGANAQVTQGAIRTGEITIAGSTTSDAYGLDFDNDGVLEIRIMDFTGSPTVYNGYFAYNWEDGGTNIIADENVWDYVGVLESGVTVGSASSSLFAGYGDASFDTYGTIALGTHYLGLRIKLTDGVHYAWAEYTMTQEGDDYRATWNSCYYEATVGADIVTGNTGGSSVTPTGTVVVADGSITHVSVPVYGYNADNYLRCQTIYPGSMLTDIAGKDIQGVTYYLTSPASAAWTGTFKVVVGTVADESFASTDWEDLAGFDTLYTGTLDGTQSTMTINFDTPFSYAGGNLVIEIIQTTKGNWKSVTFAGMESSNASLYGFSNSSWQSITGTRANFIPKTGFIVPVSCVSPTMGTITPDTRTASVAWTEEGSATAWQLKLNDGEWIDVTTNPYTLTGLTPETDYNLQLRSNCGGGDFSYSVSSSFTTLISCPAPTTLEATPTETSLELSWVESGSASQWLMKVDDGAYQTVTNPYTLTGLTANTAYDIEVRALCGAGDTSSAVSETFRTLCGTVAAGDLPFFESFEGTDFGCWEQENISGTIMWTIATTACNSTVSPYDGSKLARIVASSRGPQTRLISPVFDVDGVSNLTLTFSHAQLAWGGDQDSLVVEYRLNDSSPWQRLAGYSNNITAWANETLTLPATSATLQIAFHVYLDYGYGIALDAVSLKTVSCASPVIAGITPADTTATVTWTGSASAYGVRLDGGAEEVVTGTSIALSSLTPNTEYTVYVRSICGVGDTSEAASETFRTTCAPQTLPYEEDFDAMTTYEAPDCWTVALAYSSYGSNYPYVSTSAGRSGKGLYFYASSSNSNIIATPMLDRNANNCLVSFDAKLASYSIVRLITGVMTDPNDAATFVGLDTIIGNVNAATWKSYEVDLSSYAAIASNEAKYVAFKFDGSGDYGYLDNLAITQASSCKKPVSGSIAGITPHEAGLTWLAAAEATEYEVAYGTTNDVESRDTMFVVSDTAATLMNLDAETEYYVWVRTVCGAERTNWLALGSFTTGVACAQVTGLSLTEATLNSITIGWAIDGNEGYPSTAVMVSYKEADSTDWTTIAVSDSTFTLDSLSEGVTYNFRVTNICGGDTANYAALTASSKVCGEVAGATTNSYYIPTYSYYNYSYTQAVYTSAEVGDINVISGISYNYNGTTSTTRTVDVYIADVENATLSTGFLDISNFRKVASGYSWTITNGWSEIVFDSVFNHESGKDIVVAIDDNTGTYNSNYSTFKCHAGSGRYIYSDGTNYDPTTPPAGTSAAFAADIRFTANCGGSVQPATCDVPTNLAVANVTDSSAYISWEGDAPQYEVELNGGASILNDTAFFAGGLTPETDYAVRVRALCADSLTSEWTSVVNFTTPAAPQPATCDVPTNLAVADVTTTSATISWDGITMPETFDGDWNLYMADGDSVHTTVTPDAMMHTLLQAMGADFNDIDTTISVANSLIPVTIEPAGGNQMNISGSFQMEMIGVDEPVTFHFATTGTVGSTGMTIAPATINETVRAMNAINIDFTGSVTFVQPTALPVGGNLTIEIATINISGYGDTTINMGFSVTGTVTIGMTGSQLHASGTRDTAAQYPYYELVVTNTATGVETPVLNATTPYALENLTPSTAYTVKIRTHCDENTTSDWSDTVGFRTLDEPVVVDSCNAPTNLAVANVTAHSAAISWNGSAAQYEVELNGTVAATVNTNSYNAQGLDASTVYVVRVRALCDNSLTSEWSDTIGFRTLDEPIVNDSCDMPTNLAVSNVTANSATISWNGSAAQYEVELNGTVAATVSANSYNAQGLDASTVYVVRVRALCDNSAASEWSDTVRFRTLEGEGIDAIDANYSVNIYPNPASTRVTVNVEGLSGKAQVSVIDLSGRTLMSDTMTDGSVQLNVSSLAQGSYFVRISGERFTTVRKLIVK